MSDHPPHVRRVDPPTPVWVDLRPMLRHGNELLDDPRRDGRMTLKEVPGMVKEWARSADGGRLALVTYQLVTADYQWETVVTHWVPGHLVRRRGWRRGEREDTGKPRRTHG